ncbi:hypothetical protein D560_3211 [Bordetella holmesii ATCC 51541]|nr:hypothetical protein D560_3211 [Bordetella holmesii ATCC 51541]
MHRDLNELTLINSFAALPGAFYTRVLPQARVIRVCCMPMPMRPL